MSKNVIISVLSPFGSRKFTFTDESQSFTFTADQTNVLACLPPLTLRKCCSKEKILQA